MSTAQTIPAVDLQDFATGSVEQRDRFVATLGDALVEYGFVAIDNHGVSPATIQAAYRSISAVFDLPAEVKARYEDVAGGRHRGFTSFGQERARHRTVADLKEFWHVGAQHGDDILGATDLPPNIWPDEVPTFRESSLALWRELHTCGELLLRALALYLGADEESFAHMTDGGNTVLRCIRYPGPDELDDEVSDAVWAAAHEDINLITLLVEATSPGLQLLRRDGEWLPIAPIPGQLIADSGDVLQRLTNGVIPATTHRVLAPSESRGPRFSMPYFMHPRPEFVISPLPTCVSPERPRRWPDITAGDYLAERLREIGLITDETTSHGHAGG